jgi:hypothetical protein
MLIGFFAGAGSVMRAKETRPTMGTMETAETMVRGLRAAALTPLISFSGT